MHFSDTTVRTGLPGKVSEIDFGHPYPIRVQLFESYNKPLVELVRTTTSSAGHPGFVLDIGAGVGDTAFLVITRCPSASILEHETGATRPVGSNVSLLCLAGLPKVSNRSGRAAKGALSRWLRS